MAGSSSASARARDLHRQAITAQSHLDRLRSERNQIIRELYREDPKRWSYLALAKAIECSKELVTAIVEGRA